MTKQAQASSVMPNNIMLDKWADIGFFWQGQVATDETVRLAQQVLADQTLQISCQLKKVDGVLWLSYQVEGGLKVTCQRCLEPLVVALDRDFELALLFHEADIDRIGDAEYVMVDEISDVQNRRLLPIKALLEDELMLALPLSPRHEDCQMLVQEVGEQAPSEMEETENPFAALAMLKGNFS